jgi:hypothetical protein
MDDKTTYASGKRGWVKALVIVGVVIGAAALLLAQLPRDVFSTELSRIGQGTPALVVARDRNYLAGADVMDLIDTIRPEYEGKLQFLAAHLGHPDGQAFARRHGVQDGSVMIFSAAGLPLATLHTPQSAAELRAALDGVDIR